jgi:hypothetical protein
MAGFLSLVKVKQSIAEEDQRGRVAGVLVCVWTEKRSGFRRLVLGAKVLGSNNGGVDLGVGRNCQSGEDQCQEKTAKGQIVHRIPL